MWFYWWRIAQGIIVAHVLFAVVTWRSLPSRVPTHFDVNGQADAWTAPTFFLWFMLTGVSFGIYLLIYMLSRPGAQDLWNIPEKDRFLKLPEERQAPVVKLVQGFGGAKAAAIGLLFFVLQVGMYLTAVGVSEGLAWYVQVIIYGIPVVLLLGLIPWSQAVKRVIAEEEGKGTVA